MWTFGAAISMGRPPAGERTDEVVAVRELRITGDRPVGEAVELDPPPKAAQTVRAAERRVVAVARNPRLPHVMARPP